MKNESSRGHAGARSRSKTLNALNKVIDSLVAGNEKLSIAAVARIAGVTPGLIHNTYPEVAERIRTLTGKSVRAQRDLKHQELIREKEKSRALRIENEQLLVDLARVASVNQRLLFEIAELKAVSKGKLVAVPRSQGNSSHSTPE